MVKPILRGVMSGRNGTIFAYGQTSSGKTYTMQGSDAAHTDAGIIQMAAADLFRWVDEDSVNREYTVRVSYIEIYNEKVRDLLHKQEKTQDGRTRSGSLSTLPVLAVREDPKRGGVYVNCHETVVDATASVADALQLGNQNRAQATTSMNDQSSRSHAIFRITVESWEKKNDDLGDARVVRRSTLNMVDLAGSENGHQSGSNGLRQREGSKINQRYESRFICHSESM
jgi:centromeric protein E